MEPPASHTPPTLADESPSTGRTWVGLLSFIAGLSDVIGWMLLGGLFTAHVTGNVVVLAVELLRGNPPAAATALAVPVFIGIGAAGYVAASFLRFRHDAMTVLFLSLQTAFLSAAGAIAVGTHASQAPHGLQSLFVGMLGVAAMASQNTLLHLTGRTASTTAVMTGNLVAGTLALMEMMIGPRPTRGEAASRWRATWPLIVGFIAGCLVGTVSVRRLADAAWWVPALVSAALLMLRLASGRSKRS